MRYNGNQGRVKYLFVKQRRFLLYCLRVSYHREISISLESARKLYEIPPGDKHTLRWDLSLLLITPKALNRVYMRRECTRYITLPSSMLRPRRNVPHVNRRVVTNRYKRVHSWRGCKTKSTSERRKVIRSGPWNRCPPPPPPQKRSTHV